MGTVRILAIQTTYVSEKDFFVFLWRFETAILAANCTQYDTIVHLERLSIQMNVDIIIKQYYEKHDHMR